jgi:hypothetical protein
LRIKRFKPQLTDNRHFVISIQNDWRVSINVKG